MEILKLKEEVKLLEDARGSEVVPEIASCRCHFFDGCGDLNVGPGDDSGGQWINEVLRRRFIRLGMFFILLELMLFVFLFLFSILH